MAESKRASKSRSRLPIRHIGYLALCSARHHATCIHRIDLGAKRYKQMGVRERFKDEKPYRVCKRCIALIVRQENAWKR